MIIIAIFLGLLAGCAGPDPFPCDLETSGSAYPTVTLWNEGTEVIIARLSVLEGDFEKEFVIEPDTNERVVMKDEGPGNRTIRLAIAGDQVDVVYPMECPLPSLNFELGNGPIKHHWSMA